MTRRFPPFPAIRAFEAAARHCSMQRAADELSLSASAISHQVKALEGYVGTALFERSSSGLKLTESGAAYLPELTRALELLEGATQRASQQGESNQLVVHMFHSLAELWFTPLVGDLNRRHPNLRISILCDPLAADFSSGLADVALEYRPLAEANAEDFLFADTLIPCCSRSYLAEQGPIAKPEDLLEHPLIWCGSDGEEWSRWLAYAGLADRQPQRWIEFDLRAASLAAARAGLGIAMGRRPYSDQVLGKGDLVAPLPITAPADSGYFLAAPERSRHLKRVQLFSTWLRSVCREMQPA
ncbi:MAG: LysR substrate-binding domain-containing protein [Pseudomonadota bacterium]